MWIGGGSGVRCSSCLGVVLFGVGSGPWGLVPPSPTPSLPTEEMLHWIGVSQQSRKSHATHVNACSSRSHLFIRITIRFPGYPTYRQP